MTELDLILRGGRVLDPGQGIDRRMDLGFARGRVAALGDGLAAAASTAVLDAEGCLVIPGIIDFHAHVYWGGTSLGVEADALARGSGTTTWVDAGSAGAGDLAGFQAHVIGLSCTSAAQPRIVLLPRLFSNLMRPPARGGAADQSWHGRTSAA
jgi:dihydroorotase